MSGGGGDFFFTCSEGGDIFHACEWGCNFFESPTLEAVLNSHSLNDRTRATKQAIMKVTGTILHVNT